MNTIIMTLAWTLIGNMVGSVFRGLTPTEMGPQTSVVNDLIQSFRLAGYDDEQAKMLTRAQLAAGMRDAGVWIA